jgi:hypothetical protein
MSITEKFGSRKGFIKDVKNIGNGKFGYNKYITMYTNTQRSIAKKRLSKPSKQNINNLLQTKPEILNKELVSKNSDAFKDKVVEVSASNGFAVRSDKSVYDKYFKILTEYKKKYGNLKELDELTIDIYKLKCIKKIQDDINNNNNSSYDLKYINKMNTYGKKCENKTETNFQNFKNKYILKKEEKVTNHIENLLGNTSNVVHVEKNIEIKKEKKKKEVRKEIEKEIKLEEEKIGRIRLEKEQENIIKQQLENEVRKEIEQKSYTENGYIIKKLNQNLYTDQDEIVSLNILEKKNSPFWTKEKLNSLTLINNNS